MQRLHVIPVPCDLHHFVLNVLSQAFLQGLSNHGDLVPVNHIAQLSITRLRGATTLLAVSYTLFVGRFSEALERRRLHDGFAEGHHRVGNL